MIRESDCAQPPVHDLIGATRSRHSPISQEFCMTYQVSRNGQMYGPYALDDLKRYVASGNILPTDLAKSEEMPEWVPVSQILGTSSVPREAYATPTAYAAPSLTSQPTGVAYPDPPNLNWALELFLGFVTCALFVMVWILVIAAWAN